MLLVPMSMAARVFMPAQSLPPHRRNGVKAA